MFLFTAWIAAACSGAVDPSLISDDSPDASGPDATSSRPSVPQCIPGASVACTCADTHKGAQLCLADGTEAECHCDGTSSGADATTADATLPQNTPEAGGSDATSHDAMGDRAPLDASDAADVTDGATDATPADSAVTDTGVDTGADSAADTGADSSADAGVDSGADSSTVDAGIDASSCGDAGILSAFGGPCCDSTSCLGGLDCRNGVCGACGGGGEPCCSFGTACVAGMTCTENVCTTGSHGGPTGAYPGNVATTTCIYGYTPVAIDPTMPTKKFCVAPTTCVGLGSNGCGANGGGGCCGAGQYIYCEGTVGTTLTRCCSPSAGLCSVDADCCGSATCVNDHCVGIPDGTPCASSYECQHSTSTVGHICTGTPAVCTTGP